MAEIVSLYESIARNLGDVLAKGTGTGATGTTLDSRFLVHPYAPKVKGRDVFIYSGGGAGQARTISEFDAGNDRITVAPAWDTWPTNNPKFLVFERLDTEQYESAMNRALGIVKLNYLEDVTATLAIVATQYEYPVPSGSEYIMTLRLVPSAGTDYRSVEDVRTKYEIPPRMWRIEGVQGGSRVISIDPRKYNLGDINGIICKVEFQRKPDFTATQLPVDVEEFVIAHSSMNLAAQLTDEGTKFRNIFFTQRDIVRGSPGKPGLEDFIYRYGQGKKVEA